MVMRQQTVRGGASRWFHRRGVWLGLFAFGRVRLAAEMAYRRLRRNRARLFRSTKTTS